MDQQIGTRLRSLRRRAGMSQTRLAALVGVSASYLNLIEHNRRRLPAELMFKLADALKIDAREVATDEATALREELLEALADPVFDEAGLKATDVRDVAAQHPAIARAIALLYRRYRGAQETVEKLGSLVGGGSAGAELSRLPSEEVNDFIQRNMNWFPELEEAAEDVWQRHRLRGELLFEGLERVLERDLRVAVRIHAADADPVVRRYDPHTRVLSLSETLAPRSRHFQMAHQLGLLMLEEAFERAADDAQLTTEESRRLARMVLANYFAGALLMPYEPFFEAAERERYDVELLGHRFRASFEQVCHRLTCLRRPGREGVPFHFVKTDTAGNVSKRFSGSGIGFARFSGGCPRWNVCTTFQWPGRIRTQLSRMPDGAVYFCIARTVEKRHGGYKAPETLYAVGLGCRVEYAPRLVYADGVDLARAEVVPIGTNCRVCDRLDCEQRAFPSLRHALELDENVRRIAFYGME
ncbi:MAG TPA: short-chain fatty acyl-CoA regulator family protein [Myxococcota bacterium]|nr:short-chain fatty acyl-CoA regulator family protein [Myxococcota bacterium]